MIHSMTAFARQENQGDWGSLVWEIRSINHRYLECAFKLPESFTELESALRDLLKQQLQRGKVDCFLRYKNDHGYLNKLQINQNLMQQLISANQQIKQQLDGDAAAINTMDLLTWPGIIESPDKDLSQVKLHTMAAFEAALLSLLAMRQREGTALIQFIEQRLQMIEQEIQKAKIHLPQVLIHQRTRLTNKLSDVMASFEPTRLEQEMVLFAQRIDVEEELNRLENHVQEVRRCITDGGAQGRRLDFLMQELNREANTLGAKAGDANITTIAIALKVLIEQIREQVQNIE